MEEVRCPRCSSNWVTIVDMRGTFTHGRELRCISCGEVLWLNPGETPERAFAMREQQRPSETPDYKPRRDRFRKTS